MAESNKLSPKIINTFGMGDFGFQLMVNMELMYFTFFLTDFVKFTPANVALVLSITSISDIIGALLAGFIVQKANFKWMKWGKHRSWLLVGPPIVYLLFIFEFTKIGNDSTAFFFICAGFILSHLLWNVVYTAHIAMISVLTNDSFERTQLSQRRMVFGTAAKIIFSYTAMGIILAIGAKTGQPITGFTLAVVIFSFFVVVGYYVVFYMTKGRDIPVVTESAGTAVVQEKSMPLGDLLKYTFQNPQLFILMVADMFRNLAFLTVTAMTIFYFKVVLVAIPLQATYFVLINIFSFLGSICSTTVAKKIGKKNTYVLGILVYGVALALCWQLGKTPYVFMAILCAGNFCLQFAYAMITAMFSDVVTYGEWKTGVNTRGVIMGLLTFPIKVSVFIRGTLIAGALAGAHYVATEVPTEAVIKAVTNMTTIIPAACAIFAGLMILFAYTLNEPNVKKLVDEISTRKLAK